MVRVPASHVGGRWFEPSCLHQNTIKPAYNAGFVLSLHVFYTILFKISIARSSSLGYKWEYVFHVISIFACPNRRAIS